MNITVNENLCDAVLKGKLEDILNYISAGGNINVRMEDGNTLLHYVSTSEMTRALLLHGAEVNAVNIHGETPLHSCLARRKGLSVVHLLIKYGINVNMKNNFGQTPLHSAIADSAGRTVVRELLKHGANVNATDSKVKSEIMKPLYSCNQVINQNIFANYSIYYDIILSRLRKCLQRADLLDKLKDLRIHINLDTFHKHVENIVIFNGDCLFKIGEFLSNGDILNFLVVINKTICESQFCLDKYL